jgi:hypothetical protein
MASWHWYCTAVQHKIDQNTPLHGTAAYYSNDQIITGLLETKDNASTHMASLSDQLQPCGAMRCC